MNDSGRPQDPRPQDRRPEDPGAGRPRPGERSTPQEWIALDLYGELDDTERRRLDEACAADPALAAFRERLRAGLGRLATADAAAGPAASGAGAGLGRRPLLLGAAALAVAALIGAALLLWPGGPADDRGEELAGVPEVLPTLSEEWAERLGPPWRTFETDEEASLAVGDRSVLRLDAGAAVAVWRWTEAGLAVAFTDFPSWDEGGDPASPHGVMVLALDGGAASLRRGEREGALSASSPVWLALEEGEVASLDAGTAGSSLLAGREKAGEESAEDPAQDPGAGEATDPAAEAALADAIATSPEPAAPPREVVPLTAAELSAFLAGIDERRRRLDFEGWDGEFGALGERAVDPELARQLAGGAARMLAEARVFRAFVDWAVQLEADGEPLRDPRNELRRVHSPTLGGYADARGEAPHRAWTELPEAVLLGWMFRAPLPPLQQLDVVRFGFDRDLSSQCLQSLHVLLDQHPELKDAADPILAEHFGEAMPTGGYAWLRDRFLPFAEVHRRQFLRDTLMRSVSALGTESPLSQLDAVELPMTRIEQLGPMVRGAVDQIVAQLAGEYEPVRDLIASYRRDVGGRRRRLEKAQSWAALAAEARQFIAGYDKPQQGEVDRYRDRLAEEWIEYRRIRDRDELRLDRWKADEARVTLGRIETLEGALDSLMRYSEQYHDKLADPFPARSPQGALAQVLPGRKGSGLEDTLYTVLQWKAGRIVPFLQRADQVLAAADRLSEWEKRVLEDFVGDAVDAYDREVLTSADEQEIACVVATNAYRRTLRLRPFEIDERLVVAARGHSEEMQRFGYFGHTSPVVGRKTPSDRVRLAGYQGGAGENCIKGGGMGGVAAFDGWYHSPGHHRGLISGNAHVGVGACPDDSHYTMNMAGGDFSWRRTFVQVPEEEAAQIDRHIEALARSRAVSEASAALRAAGKAALPRLTRVLSRDRGASRSERRGVATTQARLVAEIGALQGVPTIVEQGVQTLLALLSDPDTAVRQQAVYALRRLAGKKLGFEAAAERGKRQLAALRWKQWWDGARTGFTAPPELSEEAVAQLDPAFEKPAVVGVQSPDAPVKVLSATERLSMARRMGGSRTTEKMIESSLEWMARHQHPDGGWRGQGFRGLCKGGACPNPAGSEYEIAETGLCLLSYLNGGHTIEIGEHREVVARGVHFLMTRLEDSGKFTAPDAHFMYQQAIGTQALVEAYGTSGDPFIQEAAQRAVDYLVYSQHPVNGGWRYQARKGADSSVTGWCVLALASAIKAKLHVSGLRQAKDYFDSVTEGSYYRVGYTAPNDSHSRGVRLTAVGMAARTAIGTPRRDPVLLMGTRYCLEQPPRKESLDVYYAYYATLAIFQMGGEAWDRWNKAMVEALTARIVQDPRECAHGSYPFDGGHDGAGGRIYSTALCTLMLEVYYRYEKFPEHRSFALTGAIGESLQPLIDRLKTADPVEHAALLRTIETRYGTSAQPKMIEILKESKDGSLRQAAAEVLANVAASSTLPLLLPLLDEKDAKVRVWLERAASRSADPASARTLMRHLEDERANVRRHAARLLGRLGDTRALGPLLARAKVEKDGRVGQALQAAVNQLSKLTPLDELLAAAGIGPDQPAKRFDIREGLRLLEGQNLLAPLAATKDRDRDTFAAMADEIRTLGRQSAIPLLLHGLELPDAGARDRSAKLLRALTGRNEKFDPNGSEDDRRRKVSAWRSWWVRARESMLLGE